MAQNKTKNIKEGIVLYCTVQCKQWPEDLGGILSLNQQDSEVSKGSRFYNKKVWGTNASGDRSWSWKRVNPGPEL